MVTNNSWNSQNPVQVGKGGLGLSSLTAYSLVAGGTTSTGPVQSIASLGSSGQVLTSNGAAALPTWQAASGGSGGLTLIQTQNPVASNANIFSSIGSYINYFILLQLTTANGTIQFQISNNNGSTFLNTNYVNAAGGATTFVNIVSGSSTSVMAAMYLYNMNISSTGHVALVGTGINTFGTVATTVCGQYNVNGANANSFQIFSPINNYTGSISLYGIQQ